ncbi:hypothetical protein BT69DRAFT_1286129, partial [Atractiella rhizophila]
MCRTRQSPIHTTSQHHHCCTVRPTTGVVAQIVAPKVSQASPLVMREDAPPPSYDSVWSELSPDKPEDALLSPMTPDGREPDMVHARQCPFSHKPNPWAWVIWAIPMGWIVGLCQCARNHRKCRKYCGSSARKHC